MKIAQRLAGRYELTMPEYEKVIELNREMMFGLQNKTLDFKALSNVYDSHYRGKNVLVLKEIKNYHREYIWA
jgi:3-hydroxy-3-methylglutaryl CoA synthase